MRQNLAMAPTDDKDDAATERDVMSALPRTRPQRRSARRPPAAAPADAQAEAVPPAVKRSGGAKPRSSGRAAGAGAKRSGGAKPRAAAKRRATAGAAAKPRPAAQAKAAAAPKAPAAASAPAARTGRARQAEEIPASGYATEPSGGRPGTGELVTTAFQAVGELAQIGVTVGGQALRSVLSRLPRP
jgi:hypothetical protein